MPLEDRAADTWEPLIAVADLAGGEWPELARHAAVVLTADQDQAASVSDRIRLLADCRAAFGEADALPTATLITRLRSDPEAPWSDHRRPASRPSGCRPAPRVRHPVRQHPVRRADRAGQGLLPGRFHRRLGPLLPPAGGGAVPAVPSRPRPAQARDDQNLGRIDPSHQKSRPRADLRRDELGRMGRIPPASVSSTAVRMTAGGTMAVHTLDEAAVILRVKPSWLERQAAARKIPFTMLGGSYRSPLTPGRDRPAQYENRPGTADAVDSEPRRRQPRQAARRMTSRSSHCGPGPRRAA